MNPLDYSLCTDTVTVYRKTGEGVQRAVLENCHYSWCDTLTEDEQGLREQRSFLLIVPGTMQCVFPGDRILSGIGPEIDADQWGAFLPASVPTLSEAAYARARSFAGELCHTEAGRR